MNHVDLPKMRTPLVPAHSQPKTLPRLRQPLLESYSGAQPETEDGMWFFGADMIDDPVEPSMFKLVAFLVVVLVIWVCMVKR